MNRPWPIIRLHFAMRGTKYWGAYKELAKRDGLWLIQLNCITPSRPWGFRRFYLIRIWRLEITITGGVVRHGASV